MSLRVPVLLAALACLGGSCAPALAASSQPQLVEGSIRAGARAYVRTVLAQPARKCKLAGSPAGLPLRTLSVVRPMRARITWAWRVPARARSATWDLRVACGSQRLRFVLRVHGGQRQAVLSLFRQMRVFQSGGELASPARVDSTDLSPFPEPSFTLPPAAQAWWTNNGTSVLTSFHTGVSAGQCTDYVAAKRPDVIERVDAAAYMDYLQTRSGGLDVSWVAKDWPWEARLAGMPTGKVPELGAVMVFQPGAYGAGGYGHVGFVSAVRQDGSFSITEMHAPALGRITTRSFNAITALTMRLDPGVDFIYG